MKLMKSFQISKSVNVMTALALTGRAERITHRLRGLNILILAAVKAAINSLISAQWALRAVSLTFSARCSVI